MAAGDEPLTARGLVLRDERNDDEAFLRELYASTRLDELAPVRWSPAQTDAFLRMQFDLQRMHYRRHYADASFRVVVLDGRPIGRVYVHYKHEDVRILDISLLPDARGKGIGRSLLETVFKEAARLDAPVTLHVAVGNRAQRLYERLGFRIVKQDAATFFMERPRYAPGTDIISNHSIDAPGA
jgi:ribosomal protein S18 acetylase RimI-like enzyme